MKRRSLLQGLALLVPGMAAAPAIAKEVLAPSVTKLTPGVYVQEVDLRPLHPKFDFVEVYFGKFQEEVFADPLFNQKDAEGHAMFNFGSVAMILMRRKQKLAIREGKQIRLVFYPEHRRAMTGGHLSYEDGYYYVGGAAIRYLSAEIVVRDMEMKTEQVIKSRVRQKRVYTFKELMEDGTA